MGQVLRRLHEIDKDYRNINSHKKDDGSGKSLVQFPDLQQLPPELSLAVLSHLNATDLCLAACVWDTLANDELLWMGLCKNSWGSVSIYRHAHGRPNFSYKKLYMILDEACLTFNSDPFEGEDYLLKHGIIDMDNSLEMAKFLHTTNKIKPSRKREYLDKRRDVLEKILQLQDFENQFLPNALRKFFAAISAPNERGDYLSEIIERFSERFCKCNPKLGLSKDCVFVLCYSLIMLSVDLTSPHVKNKMSKREFIKNTRRAAEEVDDDLAGHLYDNIYLIGHVAADHR